MLEQAGARSLAPAPGAFASYLRAVGAVIWKDLTAEWRSRELLGAMLVFALLVILIFNFALELDVRTRQSVTAGVLWVTFAFAGTLGLNRAMAVERGHLPHPCLCRPWAPVAHLASRPCRFPRGARGAGRRPTRSFPTRNPKLMMRPQAPFS